MNILVIGLGSMGKRRVRNLKALDLKNIAGFDPRSDRCKESKEKYAIEVFEDFEQAMKNFKPNNFVISTPPDLHMHYAYFAYENNINCFIEASVVDADKIRELSKKIVDNSIIMAPSCTMRYYPGPKKIKELISSKVVGEVLNINYQTGQYLPDWHPWEKITDFYVSSRDTGGCREIVPFELAWLNDVFGKSIPLACVKSKLTDMDADIDDIYHCILKYPNNVLANITVEVISRPHVTRELRVLGTEGELVFSSDENCVRYTNTSTVEWVRFELDGGTLEKDYINPEEPYIEEMGDFISAIRNNDATFYPNTLLDDYVILQTLYKLEELSEDIK